MAKFSLKKNWWFRGIVWGLLMFLALGIIFPLIEGESLKACSILIGLAVWIVFGLVYGAVISAANKEGNSKPPLQD